MTWVALSGGWGDSKGKTMNRHERRKAKVKKVMKVEVVTITPEEAGKMVSGRHMCIWDGCAATYNGDQPAGWRNLLVYGAPRPIIDIRKIPNDTWDRDAVLCPQHVKDLDGLLKDVGQRLKGSFAGSA
jgi:hypothetical protein